jgi:hypothetical protein
MLAMNDMGVQRKGARETSIAGRWEPKLVDLHS